MAMAVADMQFADVDSQCANLSLPTPRTRKDHALQTDPGQLAVIPTTSRTRPWVSAARLRDQRVRSVFTLRDLGPRIFARPVHQLPARDARGIQLQKTRILSQLRGPVWFKQKSGWNSKFSLKHSWNIVQYILYGQICGFDCKDV